MAKMTAKHKAFIEQEHTTMKPAQIATLLGLSEGQVKEYISSLTAPVKTVVEVAPTKMLTASQRRAALGDSLAELQNSALWLRVKGQFDAGERAFYEAQYVELIEQLGKDVVTTERIQVNQLLTHMILGQRALSRAQHEQKNLERIEKEYKEIIAAHPDASERPTAVHQRLDRLGAERSEALSQIESCESTYRDFDKSHQEIMKALKGTREQRVKNLESKGQNIHDLVREVLNLEARAKNDREIALMKEANRKKTEEFKKPFDFPDGTMDPILLSPEENSSGQI